MSRKKAKTEVTNKTKTYSKLLAPAVACALVLGMTTINACSPGGRTTEGREEAMSQNAAEAEAAEAQLAAVPEGKGEGKKDAKSGSKVAGTKDAKAGKGHDGKKDTKSVAKTDAKADAKKADKHDAHAVVAKHDAKTDAHAAPAHAPAAHAPTRNVASAGGVYVVQVGAFKVKENAVKLQEKLEHAGYKVEMQSIEHSKNGTLHLVRFEGYPSKAEAETVVEDLHAKHDLTAQVLTVSATH